MSVYREAEGAKRTAKTNERRTRLGGRVLTCRQENANVVSRADLRDDASTRKTAALAGSESGFHQGRKEIACVCVSVCVCVSERVCV